MIGRLRSDGGGDITTKRRRYASDEMVREEFLPSPSQQEGLHARRRARGRRLSPHPNFFTVHSLRKSEEVVPGTES